MAFDGIVIANLTAQLRRLLTGGHISRITQPEPDELMLTVKNEKDTYRLLISANAGLPLMYLTQQNKPSPLTAPSFCMLLRKHLNNGRITGVTQTGLDRIVIFHLEHRNEMGDLCKKKLIVELMGKHSNIIFTDETDMILDSIKHISANVSSLREVLPGRHYFVPETNRAGTMQSDLLACAGASAAETAKFLTRPVGLRKEDPLLLQENGFPAFYERMKGSPVKLSKALLTSYTGISPMIAEEICYRAGLDSSFAANVLDETSAFHLYKTFCYLMEDVRQENFSPCIYYEGDEPKEFSSLPLAIYSDQSAPSISGQTPGVSGQAPGIVREDFSDISSVLESFYGLKSRITRIRQKSSDLRRIINTLLEKDRKKYELQEKQLADTEKREKYRQYGELINAYGYGLPEGSKELEALNYYTGEYVTVPLDPSISPGENAKKYFEKYSKLKRTRQAMLSVTEDTKNEIAHLDSILTSLDMALTEADLVQLKEEMIESGYIRRKGKGKPEKITSKPFHYLSSCGFHIYVGKNNYQNENLTFKFASGNDWWFHAKNCPGSHVIVKSDGKELPDIVFEEAARLAAYYSKGRGMQKVEVDYVEKKHVKKVAGAKPGFVIYHTNYSFPIEPDIRGIQLISD